MRSCEMSFLRSMLRCSVVILCLLVMRSSCVGEECDVSSVSKAIDAKSYTLEALQEYHDMLSRIKNECQGDEEWSGVINKIHYNSGVIHLSLGQEAQAVQAFQKVVESQDPSFKALSSLRLNELYAKFGEWDKIDNPKFDAEKDAFSSLKRDVLQKMEGPDSEDLQSEFQQILAISPNSLAVRTLYNDYLLNQLSQLIDLNVGHRIVENVQNILDKHGTRIQLDERLALYHRMATVQLFILNNQPQAALRKCLNLDMDYQPCKDLMKVWNGISKSLPSIAKLTDPEEYCAFNMDWTKVTAFLLHNKKSIVPAYGKQLSNLETLKRYNDDLIKTLLTERPLSNRKVSYQSFDTQTDFLTSLHVSLCESLDFQASSKAATKYCSLALKQMLTPAEIEDLKRYLADFNSADHINGILTALYETYPHVSVHILNTISNKLIAKEKKLAGMNSTPHWSTLFKFVHDHNLSHCQLKFAKSIGTLVTKIYHGKQQQQRQQQQHHFQQMFGNQQQHQQQQHHHHQQQHAPPAVKTDKDYYKILGIEKDSNSKEIRRSYLQLTKKFHPDKQQNLKDEQKQKNEEKMAEINEAYEILSDENKRKEYDQAKAGGSGGSRSGKNYNQQGFGGFNPFGSNMKFHRKQGN